MSAVLDGQIIEGVLYLLDNNPIINPIFNCPAISITHLAGSLGFNPSLLQPRQICQAIAPLAETLFPTPRIPIFRTHLNEGWIVFEESTKQAHKVVAQPPRSNKRTTLTSYSCPSQKGLAVKVLPGAGGIPSAPLRETSSGDSRGNMSGMVDPPNSAGARLIGKGKKSFLRPFILGGKRKDKEKTVDKYQATLPLELRESGKGEDLDLVNNAVGGIVDESLQIETESPESPYEETAFIGEKSESDRAPLKGVSKRVGELRVETVLQAPPTPELAETPTSARISVIPTDQIAPISPSVPDTPVLATITSPLLTPTTAIQSIPIETDIPLTPIEVSAPTTPIPSIASPHLEQSPPITQITPIVPPATPPSTVTREAGRKSTSSKTVDGVRRRDDGGGPKFEDSKARDRERRRKREKEVERERGSRSSSRDSELTWLENVFEDLPFGPDKNLSRALQSIKRDYKLHLAEIVALGALAYMIQRSGW